MSALLTEIPYSTVHAKRASRQFGSFDGLDNRRELWRLLGRLSDWASPAEGCKQRRDFLTWCVQAASKASRQPLRFSDDTVGTVSESYFAIISLCVFPGWLDLEAVTKRLERMVRGRE